MSELDSSNELSAAPQFGDPVAAKLDLLRTGIEKDSLVPEAMAWEMADAQKPFIDEYLANNRRMTLDRIFELGQLAGQASEAARRDYLEDVNPNTRKVEVESASEVELAPTPAHIIEIKPHRQMLMELVDLSLRQLGEEASSMITTLTQSSTGKQYLQTEITAKDEPANSRHRVDSLNLYNPESGTITSIRQYTLEQTAHDPEIISVNIKDSHLPIEAAGKEAGERLVTSGLEYSKGIHASEEPYYLRDSFCENIVESLHNDDPALIANWVTRLTGAVPVTSDEIKQLYERVDVHHVSRQYRGKLREIRKVNYAENDSRKTHKLIDTLKERRQQILAERNY